MAKKTALLVLLVVAIGGLLYFGLTQEAPEPPAAQGIFTAVWLDSSDTSATETSETNTGSLLSYSVSDSAMDGLLSWALDARVANINSGDSDTRFLMVAEILFVAEPAQGAPLLDRRNFDSAWDCDFSFNEVGSPTGQQERDRFISRDFPLGASDAINFDCRVNEVNAALWTSAMARAVTLNVGGVELSLEFREAP